MNTPLMSTKTQFLNNVLIKQPNPKHVIALEQFFRKTLDENFGYFPPEALHFYAMPLTSAQLKTRLSEQTGLLVCAWHEEDIIGVLSGTAPEGGVGTIVWLMVAKPYQNIGVGKHLLSYAKEYYRANHAHKIKLTVHDEKAVRFYLREGFQKEAVHKKHWWKMDFIAMVYFF